ncbi:MAG TPA: ATP-dependent helicase [Steroidobacteraceae bacterium]|nr:ATP-dependent helicase [Steroidobacteraceae bacterium]
MSTAIATLNPAQAAAVTHGESRAGGGLQAGPLLVIAGAGTGKTSTLAHRVAHLLFAGVPPERMLLLTFTRRAALEMTRRAQRVMAAALAAQAQAHARVPENLRLPWSGTFHAIGNRLIREYAPRLGLDPGFSVLDRGDAADLVDLVRHRLGFSKTEKRFPRKDTCLAIYSHRVNTQRPLRYTLETVYPWCLEWEDQLTTLCRSYVEAKLEQQVLDYDDLLLYWDVMMRDPALAAEIGARFDHVLVDEYQDTNVLQAEILLHLKPDGAGLTVVGDDAQAIYSFRAASVENILEFPEKFSPPARVVMLEENYRSTQGVLDAANALMAEGGRQYRKHLRGVRGPGAPPQYVTVLDEQAQAAFVVDRVLEARERGIDLRRQAVLFRNSDHSDVLELELMRRNVPFVKYGGLKFLEAAHVKDLLAVLRWADNPRNRIAAFRVLQLLPGMGPSNAQRACEAFEAGSFAWSALAAYPVPAATRDGWTPLVQLLAQIGAEGAPWEGQVHRVRQWYEPQLERLYEAAQARKGDLDQLERLGQQHATREAFVTELTLDPPQATGDLAGDPLLDEDYLVLSTVHSAKGQEWDTVHLLNVTDGSFPSEFSAGRPELLEEERRLLYVAMTRAKDELRLMAPVRFYVTAQAGTGDRYVHGARSRFLTETVLQRFQRVTAPGDRLGSGLPTAADGPRVDVASRLRDMW